MDRLRAYRHGNRSEWLAAMALRLKGYRIVARNFRTKAGEIDIVARRGDLVAIVEVKARRDLATAMEAVGGITQRRIAAALAAAGFRAALSALRPRRGPAAALAGACGEFVRGAELGSVAIQARPACKRQLSALPVLMYPNVHSAPVLEISRFRLART
jgi:Holliday junction resolvase-like predicted endonuclease